MEGNVRWKGRTRVAVRYLGMVRVKRKLIWLVQRSDGIYMTSENGNRPTGAFESYDELFNVPRNVWASSYYQPTLPKKIYEVS